MTTVAINTMYVQRGHENRRKIHKFTDDSNSVYRQIDNAGMWNKNDIQQRKPTSFIYLIWHRCQRDFKAPRPFGLRCYYFETKSTILKKILVRCLHSPTVSKPVNIFVKKKTIFCALYKMMIFEYFHENMAKNAF